MNYSLGKDQRLRSRKSIERLFLEGSVIKHFPFKLVWLKVEGEERKLKVAFSVPKKRLKLAKDRNLVKRRLREAYRLERHLLESNLTGNYHLMIISLSDTVLPYIEIQNKIKKILTRFINETKTENNDKLD